MKAAKASSTWGQFMTAAYKIRIEILKGKLKIAEELLNRISDFSSEKIPFYKYYEYLSFCRFCICKKETKPVHEITALMIKEDLTTQRNARLLECYILKSIAFYLDNKIENALNTLQKAFKLSEEEGHVRIYIDEGENINKLFKLAFSRKLLPKYLTPYLDKNSEKQAETNKDTIVIINEFKENFNEREIEILKLMKKGCSNKIIADTLFISVNTVKWYASRIFAKLDAKRRGEAVSYAEKYELI